MCVCVCVREREREREREERRETDRQIGRKREGGRTTHYPLSCCGPRQFPSCTLDTVPSSQNWLTLHSTLTSILWPALYTHAAYGQFQLDNNSNNSCYYYYQADLSRTPTALFLQPTLSSINAGRQSLGTPVSASSISTNV